MKTRHRDDLSSAASTQHACAARDDLGELPGQEFRCCSPALRSMTSHIRVIPHMCVPRVCAHTLAPSVNDDEDSQHSHQSEGQDECEECV